jgi:signal transduction histidine kinase/CheY-like chemotaxis protein
MLPEVRARLGEIATDRARLLAPALLLTFVFYIVADDKLGYATPGFPYVYAWCGVGAVAALTIALVLRRIPPRLGHLAGAALLMCSASSTLVTLSASRTVAPVMLLAIQIASAGILLDTPLVIGTLVLISAAAIPLALRVHELTPLMGVSAIVTAATFAMLIHVLVRAAIVRAETQRLTSERLQQQLLHAQRMEAVGTLAAGVAHDMNNVLASIASVANLVSESSTPEQRTDLEQIVAQADRGAQLTRGLLAFSRRGQYRKDVIRIADVVCSLLPLLARMLPKSIEVRHDLAVGDACIDGDPVQLTQVIVNLAINAADAMAGTGVIEIRARLVDEHAPRPRIELAVADNGTGIDEATRLRVFEPFFTTKPIGKGSGLGLSIVWGIVQAHDGTIDVTSKIGTGTTFSIRLPTTTSRAVAPQVVPVPTPEVPRATVLLVDDEPAVRGSTKRLLERMGLEVLTAENGEVALAVYADHATAIGAVVLDMSMPVMGGAECFRRLRERANVPAIITTGYAIDAQLRELAEAGARIIEKPFAAADLRRELSQLLGRVAAS